MVSLKICVASPSDRGFYYDDGKKKMYFGHDFPLNVTVKEHTPLLLQQEGPKTTRQKRLTAIWSVLTGPLQGLLMFYGDEKTWETLVPYRVCVELLPRENGECTLRMPASDRFSKPEICVSGTAAEVLAVTAEPSPWMFDEAIHSFLWKMRGLVVWALLLWGSLLAAGIMNGIIGGAAISLLLSAGTVLVYLYSASIYRKQCNQEKQNYMRSLKTEDGSLS